MTLDLLADLVSRAQRMGADAADALLVDRTAVSVGWRMGRLERLERSESGDIGLRVLIGQRQATVSSSDRSPQGLAELTERALAMAKAVPEDPFAGLADPDQIATVFADLDLDDPVEPDAPSLIEAAARAEDRARGHAGITNSDGADAGWARSTVTLAASNGFAHSYSVTGSSLSVCVLGGTGADGMERDHAFTSAVYRGDLRTPEDIGDEAASRTLRRLCPRKVKTCKVPVIFEPRVARGLIGTLAGAINGTAVARGTSFLKDKMDQAILAPGLRVIDDPLRRRGLRSRPSDGEGLATRPLVLIEDGVLRSWLLDLRSARQLGLAPTGHGVRGTGGAPGPSPSNLYLEAGPVTPAEMIGDIAEGLFVTDLIGSGINMVTGDYSRGAAGFWISDGQITHPVSEITIAGNLIDMLRHIAPANDLTFLHGIDSPTLRLDGLTIAGR